MRRTKSEAQETRAALLDAAEIVFLEKGVSQTTLTDIAKAAGMTRGAIYWHFSDKAALFDAMQERGRLPQDFFTCPDCEEERHRPLLILHRSGVEALEYLTSNERSQRVCAIMLSRCEFVGEIAAVLGRLQQADDAMMDAIRGLFADAAKRGQLSPEWDAETAAEAYSCAIIGLIVRWFKTEQGFDLVRVGRRSFAALFADFSSCGCIDEVSCGGQAGKARSTSGAASSGSVIPR